MKKIKYSLLLVFCLCVFLFPVSVSAAEASELYVYNNTILPAPPGSLVEYPYSAIVYQSGSYLFMCCTAPVVIDSDLFVTASDAGSVVFYNLVDSSWSYYMENSFSVGGDVANLFGYDIVWASFDVIIDGNTVMIGSDPLPYNNTPNTPLPDGDGIYPSIYLLLQTYIYGADAVLTGDQTLTLTVLATAACIFLISIPFVLVWQFLKLFR